MKKTEVLFIFLTVRILFGHTKNLCELVPTLFSDYKCSGLNADYFDVMQLYYLELIDGSSGQFGIYSVPISNPIDKEKALKVNELMASLDDPNFVKFIDSKEENEVLYTLIEMQGKRKSRVHQFKYPPTQEERLEQLNMFKYILQIMRVIHNRGLILNIKNSSIFYLSDKGGYQLLNFGGIIEIGSPVFLETFNDSIDPVLFDQKVKLEKYDVEVDIYAAGMGLWDFSQLKRPYRNKQMIDFLIDFEKGEYLLEMATDFEVGFLISECLMKDRKKRMSLERLLEYTNLAIKTSNFKYLEKKERLSNVKGISLDISRSIIENHQKLFPNPEDDYILDFEFNLKAEKDPHFLGNYRLNIVLKIISILFLIGLLITLIFCYVRKTGVFELETQKNLLESDAISFGTQGDNSQIEASNKNTVLEIANK